MKSNLMKFCSAVLLMVSITSCSPPVYRLYEGAPRPDAQIARLVVFTEDAIFIDGRLRNKPSILVQTFEIQPGTYKLQSSASWPSFDPVKGFSGFDSLTPGLTWHAQAAKDYVYSSGVADMVATTRPRLPGIWEVDTHDIKHPSGFGFTSGYTFRSRALKTVQAARIRADQP